MITTSNPVIYVVTHIKPEDYTGCIHMYNNNEEMIHYDNPHSSLRIR